MVFLLWPEEAGSRMYSPISLSFSSNTFRYASAFQPSPQLSSSSSTYSPGSRQKVFEYCMYDTRRPELNTSWLSFSRRHDSSSPTAIVVFWKVIERLPEPALHSA